MLLENRVSGRLPVSLWVWNPSFPVEKYVHIFKTLGFTAESRTNPKNENQQLLRNKLQTLQTRKLSQLHEEIQNSFLGLKTIWNSKAEMPKSVIKSNQDMKFNLNIEERKAYTVLNRFCHVMCQSRPDTIPLYLVARCLHFEFASKFLKSWICLLGLSYDRLGTL